MADFRLGSELCTDDDSTVALSGLVLAWEAID
ncbi:hypothetical protein KR49_11240 [Synechococcus sp. KORDI-49]|nr:hypothetical protein KR49_11240 [Synechococcus sp. KORDI-49]